LNIDFDQVTAPVPTPETEHFWSGCVAGELRLQQCDDCHGVYFPPRPFCPACGQQAVTVICASGKARLLSYVINHRPHPAFEGPYAIAVVELVEGVKMMSNILNVSQTPEALVLDMPLTVAFRPIRGGIVLPYFEPDGAAS
jgi:uncharacterized OB-fold protein|tara:strand:- start:1238 stop:1660 length:423 start_codon:yes stop_codon:yes gene_type:complete